jgi:hypothetical protein
VRRADYSPAQGNLDRITSEQHEMVRMVMRPARRRFQEGRDRRTSGALTCGVLGRVGRIEVDYPVWIPCPGESVSRTGRRQHSTGP